MSSRPTDAFRAHSLCRLVLAACLLWSACEKEPSEGVLDGSDRDQGRDDDDEGDGDDEDEDDEESQGDGDTKPGPDEDDDSDGGSEDEEEDDAGVGSTDPFAALRQACLDTINQYRATLKRPPLKRAPNSEERCSDQGAKYDHERKMAHGSAAEGALTCRDYGVAQNTCPDHAYRNGDREGTMKRCLQSMWDEGEPDEGIDQCVDDYFNKMPACFLAHGHYINMQNPDTKTVSCGFFDDGKVLWMNQDFR